MTRFTKRLAVGVVVIVLALGGWAVYIWTHLLEGTPSYILDFHPSAFQATAASGFFYSIGDELKYSDKLNPNAPTLLRGELGPFLVSPNEEEIAIVANGFLTVIARDGSMVRQVTHVDWEGRDPKPIGEHFYRADNFQWTRDSKSLYLVRDEYSEPKPVLTCTGANCGDQSNQELWKYDIPTGSMQRILSPFPATRYFLGRGSGIYFSAGTKSGDLQLKYFDGKRIEDVGAPGELDIPVGDSSGNAIQSPFFSFSDVDYQDVVLPAKGVALVDDQNSRLQRLVIRDTPYLTIKQGKTWKAPYYCSQIVRSVFLPGDRYFLFNAIGCGNYSGQLLIDTQAGQYERLPSNTVVYFTLTTDSDPHYRIWSTGIFAK